MPPKMACWGYRVQINLKSLSYYKKPTQRNVYLLEKCNEPTPWSRALLGKLPVH